MKVVFDPGPGKLFDLILAVGCCKKVEDTLKLIKSHNISYMKEITEAYRYIWDGLDTDLPGLEAFVASGHRDRFLFHYFFPHVMKWRTADVFIENFDRMIHNEMLYDMLSYFDAEDHPTEYYKVVAGNPSRLYEFVSGLDVSDRVRLDLVGIASGCEQLRSSLKTLLQAVAGRLDDVYDNFAGLHAALTDKMRNRLDPAEEFFMMKNREFMEGYRRNHYDTALVTMSFIYPIIIYYRRTEGDVHVFLGAENNMQQTYENGNISRFSLFFQAMSDESRIKIVELLREREMFIGEISSALAIPLTTLTYHIKMLNAAEIIGIRNEGKKTYCCFSRDEMKSAASVLESIGGRSKD